MKKYDLSKIMKRAWELVKKVGFGISEALKSAWKEAKEMASAKTWDEIEKAADKYCEGSRYYWTVSRWQKCGHDRAYINIRRKNSQCQTPAGYWDMKEDKYVSPSNGINLAEI